MYLCSSQNVKNNYYNEYKKTASGRIGAIIIL